MGNAMSKSGIRRDILRILRTKAAVLTGVIIVLLIGAIGVRVLQNSNAEAGFGPSSGRPFTAASPWNAPIGSNVQLDPNSSSWVSKISSGGGQVALLYDYGDPVFDANASTPKYNINCTENWGTCGLELAPVPIPTNAKASPGSDAQITILDYDGGKGYCLWRYNNDRASTSWGTAYSITGDGILRDGGCNGAAVPSVAGLVRVHEVRAGQINHALKFATTHCGSAFRLPATKSDGKAGGIPEGSRFQLDPALNVDSLGLNAGEKMIARALQTYGAYVTDCSGSNVSLAFENPKPTGKSDPYPGVGLTADYYNLGKIPWNRMRVLAAWNSHSGAPVNPTPTPTPPTPTPPTPTPTPPTPTPPTTPTGSDLVVTTVSAAPAAPSVGSQVVFSAVVKNQGTAATPAGQTIGASFSVNGTKQTWAALDNTVIPAGGTLTLTARGSESNAAVNYWTATAGSHTVEAFVDDALRITESNESNNKKTLSLTVGASTPPPPPPVDAVKPTVSLTAPAANGNANVGSTVNLAATASDNVGVTKVEFYAGTTLLGSDTTNPYTYAWNTSGQAAGSKSLTARAFDAAGNNTTSSAVSFTLNSVNTTTPGDANNDGRVNALDLSVLITNDGKNYQPADFNGDGVVGAADMAILLSRWTW